MRVRNAEKPGVSNVPNEKASQSARHHIEISNETFLYDCDLKNCPGLSSRSALAMILN